MTRKEKEILEAIKENPMISHEELSKLFNISKKTVAVHIANLTNQGYLLGRAYIVDENYVVGIGACNIDIYGKSAIKIKTHFDHPSKIYTSLGGVTRNILENLSYLGIKTKLFTAIGEDLYGDMLINSAIKIGIDTKNILKIKDQSTSVFMQVQDDNNDMYLALCDMSIINNIDINYLREKRNTLKNAKAIIFDPSLNEETIKYLVTEYKDKSLMLDPISLVYAKKIKPYLKYLTIIKPNKQELEILADMKINNDKDLIKASQKLISKGVKKIYVSLGKDGCLYMDKDRYIKKKLKEIKALNASGAGDSFFAGAIYAHINNLKVEDGIDYALACGKIAISSKETSNKYLSLKEIKKILKENKK